MKKNIYKVISNVISIGMVGIVGVFVYLFIKKDNAGLGYEVTDEMFEKAKGILKGNFLPGTSAGGGGSGGGSAF